jgi:hypothetical protein
MQIDIIHVNDCVTRLKRGISNKHTLISAPDPQMLPAASQPWLNLWVFLLEQPCFDLQLKCLVNDVKLS